MCKCKGSPKLVLSTGEVLPNTWLVKITHTVFNDCNTLIDRYTPGEIFLLLIVFVSIATCFNFHTIMLCCMLRVLLHILILSN